MVYRGMPSGSWMHATCFFCSLQMVWISSLKSGTPRVSVAVERLRSNPSIVSSVSVVPLVVRLQCFCNSSLLMAFLYIKDKQKWLDLRHLNHRVIISIITLQHCP